MHGKVEKTREVEVLTGRDTVHYVVRMKVDENAVRDWIVDLGPKERLKVSVKEGDAITVLGRRISVGIYDNVLLATRVSKRGEVQQITRSQSSYRDVRGKIDKVIEVSSKATRKTHRVVRIQTRQGKRMVVDLGDRDNLKGMELAPGTTITVEGRQVRVKGRPIVMAERVVSGDKERKIDRKEFQKKAAGTSK